jgi:hypothetical protein
MLVATVAKSDSLGIVCMWLTARRVSFQTCSWGLGRGAAMGYSIRVKRGLACKR